MTGRVAIVGRAAVTALGDDFARTLAAFESGAGALAPWPGPAGADEQVARIPEPAAPPDDDATRRVLGPHGRWMLATARAAHAEAGFETLPREEVGLFAAMGMVDPLPEDLAPAITASRDPSGAFDLARFHGGGFRGVHPLWPLSMLGNVAIGHVAIALDLRGDNAVLAADALSGVRAVVEARRALSSGAARAALVGGVAEPVSEASLARRRLADARPGARTWGSGPGEAAAVLALEEAESARARGAQVLGWIAGAATRSNTGMPRSLAGDEAVESALAQAGVELASVGLVVLVGAGALPAGTWVVPAANDRVLPRLLADLGARCVSTAAALGDVLGAGPVLGTMFALAWLGSGRTPPARTTRGERAERPPGPPDAPQGLPAPAFGRHALVLLADRDGSGALLVESPACAS